MVDEKPCAPARLRSSRSAATLASSGCGIAGAAGILGALGKIHTMIVQPPGVLRETDTARAKLRQAAFEPKPKIFQKPDCVTMAVHDPAFRAPVARRKQLRPHAQAPPDDLARNVRKLVRRQHGNHQGPRRQRVEPNRRRLPPTMAEQLESDVWNVPYDCRSHGHIIAVFRQFLRVALPQIGEQISARGRRHLAQLCARNRVQLAIRKAHRNHHTPLSAPCRLPVARSKNATASARHV